MNNFFLVKYKLFMNDELTKYQPYILFPLTSNSKVN